MIVSMKERIKKMASVKERIKKSVSWENAGWSKSLGGVAGKAPGEGILTR